jgi:outer membrane protein TolC
LQLTHQAVSVFEEALVAAKSFYDNTMNRFNEGLIQKSDLLNVEVQMLDIESQLDEAKSNIVNASDYLSVLMNQPTGTTYTTEKMFESLPNVELSRVIPLKRSDFLAMDKAIIATGIVMKSLKMKQLPRLNLFASYQLNNKKIFSFNANAYLAGIQLSWNLFDGNATRYQLNHMKLEQSKLQVQLQSMQLENQMMLDKSFRDQGMRSLELNNKKLLLLRRRNRGGYFKTDIRKDW